MRTRDEIINDPQPGDVVLGHLVIEPPEKIVWYNYKGMETNCTLSEWIHYARKALEEKK